MSLPRPICTRLPPDLEARLEARLDEQDWTPSEGLRRIVHEWLAAQRFEGIEFRDTPSGRHAALRGGPEVWEIAEAAGEGRAMSAALAQKFAWVSGEAVEVALAYARAFRPEIDRQIAHAQRFR